MTLAILTHDAAFAHVMPPGHPERAERMHAVRAVLDAEPFAALPRLAVEPAPDAFLLRGHPRRHLERLAAAAPAEGFAQLDPDTWMSPGTLDAARLAAGAVMQAVDAVLDGEARRAFVAMRPPGHHAEPETPMGFCLFGNVALGALHAIHAHGLERVAVIDFDVHHGNGTQALLRDEPRAVFVSSHQMPLWPGTGAPGETGPHGTIVNLPLRPGTDGAARREAMAPVLERLHAWAPELVLLSAGFDADARDPLAELDWGPEDFAEATREAVALAEAHAGGRVVSALEGGYDLAALGEGVAAHLGALMEGADG
jgi:acetoin utilization deacetylase AcuC-like enzyme